MQDRLADLMFEQPADRWRTAGSLVENRDQFSVIQWLAIGLIQPFHSTRAFPASDNRFPTRYTPSIGNPEDLPDSTNDEKTPGITYSDIDISDVVNFKGDLGAVSCSRQHLAIMHIK
jgi:hypothetical protein